MQAQTRMIWLKAASDVLIIFGLLTALASMAATAAPISFLVDMVFWPVDGAEAVATGPTHLLAGITGGLTVGLGVLLYLLTTRLYPSDPALTRLLMSAGLGSWFIVDSLGSFVAGASLNVLFNIGFLALFMVPLWLPGASSTQRAGDPTSGMRQKA